MQRLNELTFKGYEDAMIFCVFICIFCLELTVGEQLMRTTSVTIMVFFSKVPFWNYLITAIFKVLSKQLRGTLTMAFETKPYSWRFLGHGSTQELIISWVIFLKRKSTKVPGKLFTHNNPSLLFEEHCTKTFHLWFYASVSLK